MFKLVALAFASMLFEFSYVAWGKAIVSSPPHTVAMWGVVVAWLGLIGIGGALAIPGGWVAYLIGIGVGGYASAWLAGRRKAKPTT